MENTLLVGLSRQMALSRQIDVVANNVANLNTNGYKSDGSIFEEFIMPTARELQFQSSDGRLSFVNDRGIWHDLSPGNNQHTGNPLDVAIDGPGYLVVQTPNGERYTRNGALQIDSSGQLVSANGMPVLGENGPIVFQPTDRNISISQDGRISVVEGANSRTESLRGKLRVVNFEQPQLLQKDGGNNFLAPAGVQPQPVTNVRVAQGMIEKSNVNAVLEMTRLFELTRTYSQISNLIQQEGDLRRSAIQQLAEVPS